MPESHDEIAHQATPASHRKSNSHDAAAETERQYRTREHLTDAEIERLMAAARNNRWGHRDATMILVAYRHGLRVSELVDLRWEQVDFNHAVLHVRRAKKGTPATHPIIGDEMRALRRLQREQEPRSPFVFTSERGSPFTTAGFARMLERAGEAAGLALKVHPHMLRHACGFALANKGHDTRALQAYLGHRNIQHTVRYTELSPGRFKDFGDNALPSKKLRASPLIVGGSAGYRRTSAGERSAKDHGQRSGRPANRHSARACTGSHGTGCG